MRCQQSPGRSDDGLVNTVLDALPSPTVLLDPDGVIVIANSAWTDAGVEHGAPISTGADYYAATVGLHDDPEGKALVQSLRELARGELPEVSIVIVMSSVMSRTYPGRRRYHACTARMVRWTRSAARSS